ncbi:hypothetical protein EJ994_03500 [Maribacter sp. MJ134]|uniref:hypothetical protein n=1 Tax=Maribacter sp. MJ134 TaxID=2496865 RepID=UPI000F819E6A|nr:hypothetical protein [Maribacter sp. MJ134]AZQ57912.1 hypothetical protein EJ994_03500 [Maribacter sp. MJ134]
MTADTLTEKLNGSRLNKNQIMQLVDELKTRPELTAVVLKVIYEQDKLRKNFNACWVFDHLMRKKLDYILPNINIFIEGLTVINWESTLRPMSHVLEMVNERYFVKKDAAYIKAITFKQQEIMAEVCFDWLIGQHKVATKVFAMTNLFYLGERFDWIRPELKKVLEQSYASGSAGYRTRAWMILNRIK